MKRRVAIIGTGWVGSSIAISVLHSGTADELLLYDVRAELVEGEALDLAHGASFYPPASVRTATIEEIVDADIVVVAAGAGGSPGQSRLDLIHKNAGIVADLGRRLAACRGTIIMVTNPVDILTWLMRRVTGLPPARIVGTGTMLDTARLRQLLARTLDVDPRSVHGYVVGEHGDSEVVLWSGVLAGGVLLRKWAHWDQSREHVLAEEVRTAAYEIIRRKGATNHAIGLVTADLVRCILRGERRVLTVSRVQEGALGFSDVALSLPTVVGIGGAERVLEPELHPEETKALEHSAEVLRLVAARLPA